MLRGKMMDKYYITKEEGKVNVSLHPPFNDDRDYLHSFINIYVDGSVDSPFKTVEEAEEFVCKVMELLKE